MRQKATKENSKIDKQDLMKYPRFYSVLALPAEETLLLHSH